MNAPDPIIAPFVPGLFPDMPGAAYHEVEAMSASGAKKMIRSPLHYKLMRDTPNVPTAPMQFGTATHACTLEPHTFDALVVCEPQDAPRRPTSAQFNAKKPSPETVEAIAWWQEFNRASIGKIVLSASDHARVLNCAAAVRAHPAAAGLLDGATIETSLFWTDGLFKVPCKARFDAWNHGLVIDLKTCQDASPEAFARSAASLLYHLQAAFYFSAAEHVLHQTPQAFVFICVESEPPHAVACYALPSNAILAGNRLANLALERYAAALADGEFRGYPPTIETLPFPKWATQFTL